ncbi:MAG: nuclear transport factor 2 family protein [Candidatus Bathyarchaeia archaeon]
MQILRVITCTLLVLLILAGSLHSFEYVAGSQSVDESQQVRKIIREYVRAMNRKSVEALISLYTIDGEYVDESFDASFSGPDQLRRLYSSIFEQNPKLTFTAFPWNIEATGEHASATCSWSLVGDYGVYNGVYLISMRKVSGDWKIREITAHITVVHYYNPPYLLLK